MDEHSSSYLVCGLGTSGGKSVPNKSLIEIGPVIPGLLRRGDIIVFEKNDKNICHRVLKVRKEGDTHFFFTKGDGNLGGDGWISSHSVLGRVISVNGLKTDSPRYRWLSYWWTGRSLFGNFAQDFLFKSRVGKTLGALKYRYITKKAILTRILERFFAG